MTTPITVGARPSTAWTAVPLEHGDPCTMVIFGGTGDLTRRKLVPALYHLERNGLLAEPFAILGVGREPMTDDAYRAMLRDHIARSDDVPMLNDATWRDLAKRIFYCSGDLTRDRSYAPVKDRLAEIESRVATGGNRLFYLAVPPSVFRPIVEELSDSGLAPRTSSARARPWVRIVIEKPYGRSLESARDLNAFVLGRLHEHQVFRIDHYLGKETVQNILVLRFANSIFEPLWNRQSISHVQITAAETVGVGTRGGYYEEAGVLRDMFQNHLLQLLTLTAMEPPVSIQADAVRDEKVKVLRSVRWYTPQTIPHATVRAQYAAGAMDGGPVPGYREERGVAPDSRTPTYAALRVHLDNWRWKGVPFLLRSGKRLAKRTTEIAVTFREPPHLMFGHRARDIEASTLVLRVQPDEGISLRFEVKCPGAAGSLTPQIEVAPVEMNFTYRGAFGDATTAPAYETLLLDAMIGNATLFARSDEVEAAWKVVDPVIEYWEAHPPGAMPVYPAGSWGPAAADALIAADGFAWRRP